MGLIKRVVKPPVAPITLVQYMMGRDNDQRYQHEWSFMLRDNAIELLARVNRALQVFGKERLVRSGWRPKTINHAVGGAPGSLHITGQAIDLDDADGALHRWFDVGADMTIRSPVALKALVDAGLWMEAVTRTPSWCHWQSRPPASGRRIFQP